VGIFKSAGINSTGPCYKASTKKFITKTVQIHKNKTLNRQNKNNVAGKKQYK